MPGDFPWSSSSSGSATARAHFGRRYRTASAFLARYEEEREYEQAEIIRTVNWVEEQAAAVSLKLQALHSATGPSQPHSNMGGQIILLERRLKQLSIMAADIGRVRSKFFKS